MVSTNYNYPINEPDILVKGDSFIWYRDLSYLNVDPTYWVLSYSYVPVTAGNTPFYITASDNGDGRFLISVGGSTTETYAPDEYIFQAYATDIATGKERHTLYKGQTKLVADFATTAQSDFRSNVKKILDSLQGLIEGKMTADQQNISVAGRSISKIPIPDAIKLLETYKELYNKELQQEQEKQNRVGTGNVYVKFNGPNPGNPRNWLSR